MNLIEVLKEIETLFDKSYGLNNSNALDCDLFMRNLVARIGELEYRARVIEAAKAEALEEKNQGIRLT